MIVRVIIGACLFLLALFGIGAFLSPPKGDAEAFYMTYPKIIAASERIIPMATPGYWSFSQVGLMGEMHFAALMQLSGVQAAKLFVWPISVAAALMLMGVAAESGVGRTGQWFAVIMLLTSSAFTTHITNGKVDLFAAALGISAFYWGLKASSCQWRKSALAVTGLFTGFAVVAKLPYIVALAPSVLLLVMARHYLAETRPKGRTLLSLLAVAGQLSLWFTIAVIPHMIKNEVFFQAPLTPLIGPPELTWLTEQSWLSPEETRRVVLTYPYALVFGRYGMQEGRLSFLLLVFILLAVNLPRAKLMWRHSALAQITIAALLGTVIWVFLKPSVFAPRYMLATLLMFIPLAAGAAEYSYQSEKTNRWLWIGIIALLILALGTTTHRPLTKWPSHLIRYAKGEFSECELASKYCNRLKTVNQVAMPGARIYFAGYYSFWLRPDLLQCCQTPRDGSLRGSSETMKAKWAHLFDRGFEYLVIDKLTHRSALEFIDKSHAPDWLKIENIWDDPLLLIYKITAKDERRNAKVACRQISGPAWDIVEL
jgi:hypothetical protein